MEFLSSNAGEPRKPLMWPQGSSVSIRVARGSTALLWSRGRGVVHQCLDPQAVAVASSEPVTRVRVTQDH